MGNNTIIDADQVANKMGAFGLNNGIVEDSASSTDEDSQEQDQEIEASEDVEETEGTGEESDERGSVDASNEAGDEDTGSEDGEEDDSEDGGSDGGEITNPELVALNNKIDRLTQDSRAWQSRYDQEVAARNKPRAADTNQDGDEFDDLEDDEMPTGADIKASAKRSQVRKQALEVEREADMAQQRDQAWLNTKPDRQAVVDYYIANNLESDPEVSGQTTASGIYAAVKLKMTEASIDDKVKAEVEKSIAGQRKKLIKTKSNKGKVPDTGGGASKKSAGGRGLTPISAGERQYMKFMGEGAQIISPKR